MEVFKGLDEHFTDNGDKWRKIYEAADPQKVPFPSPWKKQLTDVQKMIIMRVLRPDKVIPSIQNAII